MYELVKIFDNNGKKVVSARNLYSKLGYDMSNYAKWFVKNIVNNEFAIENEDWVSLVLNTNVEHQLFNPNPTRDFALIIPFAKKLSMLARTKEGEQVRDYFIECEKIAIESTKTSVVNLSRLDILKIAMEAEEENVRLKITNGEQSKQLAIEAPKVEYYDKVLKSENTYTTTQIAKELGMSAKALNIILNDYKVQFKQNNQWLLYSKHQNKGYTKTNTVPYIKNQVTGETGTAIETVWTEIGREFIHSGINKLNKKP
jgi:anti-repressor protein